MARTLKDLQSVARSVANRPSVDLLREPGLGLVNQAYRLVGRLFPWDELGTTRAIATTEKGRESYPWLGFSEFLQIESVTVQAPRQDLWPQRVNLCHDEYRWTRAGREGTGQPRIYRIAEESGVPRLLLRPAPAWSGLRVEVSGTATPAALWSEQSRTVFHLPEADFALCCLVGAALANHDRQTALAARLVLEAAQTLEAVGVSTQVGVLHEELDRLVADLPRHFSTAPREHGTGDEAERHSAAAAGN